MSEPESLYETSLSAGMDMLTGGEKDDSYALRPLYRVERIFPFLHRYGIDKKFTFVLCLIFDICLVFLPLFWYDKVMRQGFPR